MGASGELLFGAVAASWAAWVGGGIGLAGVGRLGGPLGGCGFRRLLGRRLGYEVRYFH